MKILVNGVEITDYLVNDITFNYDAICSTFSLSLPYFEYWGVSQKLFKPLKYQKVEIFADTKLLLTGTIITNDKETSHDGVNLALTGYSKTGVLNDCQVVNDSNTKENLTFKELIESLIKPFDIQLIIDKSVIDKCNEKYDLSISNDSDSIANYISKLATLKNIVVTTNAKGQLVLTQVNAKSKPIANFGKSDNMVTKLKLSCNGQNMHSSIKLNGATDLYSDEKTDANKQGESKSITNTLIKVHRPKQINQGTETKSIDEALKAVFAKELENIVLTIFLNGWKLKNDDLLLPGDIISINSPQIGLYKTTNFIIKNVSLSETPEGRSSTLVCVLPETFTGESPTIEI